MQKKVQAAINRLVAAVHAEEPPELEKDLAILHEAFEEDEDSPFNSADQDVYYVWTFDPEDSLLSDAVLLEHGEVDIESGEELTDAVRVSWFRTQVEEIINGEGDADEYPVFAVSSITHTDGREAYLVCGIGGYSFTEISKTIDGPYATPEEALASHGNAAITSEEDLAALTDEAILQHWRRGTDSH